METAAKGYVLLAVAMVASPVFADDGWVALSGPEIEAALDDRTLKYETATQTFYKSGKTLYDSGRPSWGYWRIQGDEYCSEWPPNAGWDCYGFERRIAPGTAPETEHVEFRFISGTGHVTKAVYSE